MSDDEDRTRRWPHQRLAGALARGLVAALGLAPVFVLLGSQEPGAVLHLFVVAVIVASAAFLTEHRGRAGLEVWARLAIAGAVGAVLAFGATLWLQHMGDPMGAWRELVKRPEQLFGGALAGGVLGTVMILALGPWFHARACTLRLGPQVAGGLCVAALVVTPWLSLGDARPFAGLDLLAALMSGALVPLFVYLSEAPERLVARWDPQATTPLEVDPRPAIVVSLAPLVLAVLVASPFFLPEKGRPHPSGLARLVFRELPKPDAGVQSAILRSAVVVSGHVLRFVTTPDGEAWIAALDPLEGGPSYVSNHTRRIVAVDGPIALDVTTFQLPPEGRD